MKTTRNNIHTGDVVVVGGREWIVLEGDYNGYLCISKEPVDRTPFGMTNNYANSNVRKVLKERFLEDLVRKIGADALIDIEFDLGLYGKMTEKVGLLTKEMYEKYDPFIQESRGNDFWYLATPTQGSGVYCVCNDGTVYTRSGGSLGVRPVCAFSEAALSEAEGDIAYCGTVVCVNPVGCFTRGKLYEVDDDIIIDDCGAPHNIDDIEDEFLEIVE